MDNTINTIDEKFLDEALKLVTDTFMKYDAPQYSKRGIEAFLEFANTVNIKPMLESGYMELTTYEEDGEILGVLAWRGGSHISMFFVDGRYHRIGIGRFLMENFFKTMRERGVPSVTVNSSPYAVKVYEKYGFTATGDEQVTDGIRYTPMEKIL